MNSVSKILVVDDEAVIRELLSDILEDDGYPVETMSNGPAALKLLRDRDDFVLLFTDIMMPEMDGIQLIREARKLRPSLIPIVMTGFATLETARAAVKEGAYDYVLKPFSLSEVKLAVSNALDRYRLGVENARLQELTQIFEISERIAGIRDEQELLDYVLDAALKQVGAYRGSLMILSPDGHTLQMASSVGLPEEAQKTVIEVGKGISGSVAQKGHPLLVEDINAHPEVAHISMRLPERSFLSVPIGLGANPANIAAVQQCLAVLNVTRKQENGRFSEADLTMLNIVAKHAAVAIENVRLLRSLEGAHLATIEALVRVLESRDPHHENHSARVMELATKIAKHADLSARDIETLRMAARFYDVGKLAIGDAVLTKREPLSEDEWNAMQRHPLVACDLIHPVPILDSRHVEAVRSHHERMDGSGYPDGLSGESIPKLARVLGLADACVAMASRRPYREALSQTEIKNELRKNSGTQFDPDLSAIAANLIENGALS